MKRIISTSLIAFALLASPALAQDDHHRDAHRQDHRDHHDRKDHREHRHDHREHRHDDHHG